MAKIFRRDDLITDYAMRYGNPSIPAQMQSLKDRGCSQIGDAAHPQYAASTTATVNDEVFKWR